MSKPDPWGVDRGTKRAVIVVWLVSLVVAIFFVVSELMW